MAEWQTFRLIDVLDYKEGPGILAKDFHNEGVPLVRLAGVKVGAHILDGCNYLDPEKVASKWSHFRLEEGDTLLSTSASLGEVAVVPADGVGAVPYTGLIRFRPRDERVSGRFVPIALTSRTFKLQIEAMGVGSVMKHFGPMHLRQMELELPPRPVQEAIADVVEALDDKIAANARLAASAARLSRALYEAALAEGEHRRGKFFEYFTVTFGAAFKGDQFSDPGSGRPLLRIRDLKTFVPQVWTTEKRRDETVVSPGDVLVGMDGDFSPTPWFGVEGVLNQRVCSVQSSNSRAFTLEAIRAPIAFIEGHKAGTTVIHLNKKDLAETPVVLPSSGAAGSFDARASRLLDVQVRALSENRALTALRDTLLPQLMSGKLRVREAAEMAGL